MARSLKISELTHGRDGIDVAFTSKRGIHFENLNEVDDYIQDVVQEEEVLVKVLLHRWRTLDPDGTNPEIMYDLLATYNIGRIETVIGVTNG